MPFIRTRFNRAGKEIGDELIQSIFEQTEGHPFCTQHLCHVLWELCGRDQKATKQMLGKAIDLLLDRESYAYTSLWESFGINQRRFLRGLAHEPRATKVYAADFIRRHGLRSPSNAHRVVDSLMERDVIDRDNGSFLISDRFLRLWIRRAAPPYGHQT